jgi:thioredoxin reductase (NADPH)
MPSLTAYFEIPDEIVDLLVVGLGPAGVACALQAHRDGLHVVAVGDEPVGGLVRAARRLDNLPAEPGISGAQLAERMSQQIDDLGVSAWFGHVRELSRNSEAFLATLADGRTLRSRAVCLAAGTRPREWERSVGTQTIHRDARSLPESLKGMTAVVIGGGEAALDTALSCTDRGAQVRVLVRGDRLRAAPGLIDESRNAGVELRLQTTVERVRGGSGDWLLTTRAGEELTADLLVVCIGRIPRDEFVLDLVGDGCRPGAVQTHIPGLSLAGDLIRGHDRYVATAMGDGQRAALAATAYLKEEA